MRPSRILLLAILGTAAASSGIVAAANGGFLAAIKTIVREGWRNGMRSIAQAYGKDYAEMKELMREQNPDFIYEFKDLCESWSIAEQSLQALPLDQRPQFETTLSGLRKGVTDALHVMYGASVLSEAPVKKQPQQTPIVGSVVRSEGDNLYEYMNVLMKKHEEEKRVVLEALRRQQQGEAQLMEQKLEKESQRRTKASNLFKSVQSKLHDINVTLGEAKLLLKKCETSAGHLDMLKLKVGQMVQGVEDSHQVLTPSVVCGQAAQLEDESAAVKATVSDTLTEANSMLARCGVLADDADNLCEDLADLGNDFRRQSEPFTVETATARVSIDALGQQLQQMLQHLEPKQLMVDELFDKLGILIHKLGQQLASQLQHQVLTLRQFTEQAASESKKGIESDAEELLSKVNVALSRVHNGFGDTLGIILAQMAQLVNAWLATVESARTALDGASDVGRKILKDANGLPSPDLRAIVDTASVEKCIQSLQQTQRQIRQAKALVNAKFNTLRMSVQEKMQMQNQMAFGGGGGM